MAEPSNGMSGLAHAVRGILDTVVAMVESRLELASVEAREEKARAIVVLALLAGTVLAGAMAMVLLTALGVYLCRANAVWALGGFAVVYAALAYLGWRTVRRQLRKPFFEGTIDQIKKDREWLFPRL